MSTNVDPERLVSSSSELGRLIRTANDGYSGPFDEARAWQRLEVHYSQHIEARRRHVAYAFLPLAAAAAAFIYWRTQAENDIWRDTRVTADRAAVAVQSKPVPAPIETTEVDQPPPVSSLPTAAPQQQRAIDCTAALKHGPARDMASCLERLGAGNSIEAERAMLELANVKHGQLRDAAGAVNVLRNYRQRFPDGALKGEVDFALVELLPKAGQAALALAESEALLSTAWGRSRSSELRLMRGRLAQDHLGNPQLALEELSYVKDEFGPVGDEATLRTAECLERMGKRELAIETYRAYLARDAAGKVEYVRERLRRLDEQSGPSSLTPVTPTR